MSEQDKTETVPGAQLVGGVYLPATEIHMVEWMTIGTGKRAREVEGKLTYQYHKLEGALKFCPPERRRVVVDIGGHIGTWSMWLVNEFEELVAFEPIPMHGDLFERNVANNAGPDGRWRLHRCALGDRDDSVAMHQLPVATGSAHVCGGASAKVSATVEAERLAYLKIKKPKGKAPGQPDHCARFSGTTGTVQFPRRTLDSFSLDRVDFIKIDVEGQELPVVTGARETILRSRPVICVEQKGWNADHVRDWNKDALNLLKSWGMVEVWHFSGDHVLVWK